MKLSTTAAQLHETISVAAMITPTKAQLAAHSAVLLEGTRGRLTVRGTNGETTVTAVARVSDVTDGSVLVPPGPVLTYLAALTGDTPVTVTSPSPTQLLVAAGAAAPYKFTALPESFPTSTVPRRDKVEADLSGLAEAVAAVASCADALSGSSEKVVQLVSDDTGLRLHATDRFRVARATLPASSGFGEFDGLLPLRVLSLAASIHPTHIQLDPKGRTMVFHAETVVVATRLSQNPFPVVDSVLSGHVPYTVALDRLETLRALRRLSAVAPPKGAVRLDVAGDQLTLSVTNAVSGSGAETVTLGASAPADLEMALNFEFFKAALETHTSAEVTMGWSASFKPLFLSSTATLPVTHAIMPVQI